MRVALLVPELNVGGVETGTVDLARELVRRGHQVVVISNGGALVPQVEEADGRHLRWPMHRKNPLTVIQMIIRLIRLIGAEQIELVHAQSRVPAWIGFIAARVTHVKFITSCHGYYGRHLFSSVMGWGQYVIVISHAVGKHMVEHFDVPVAKIRLIHRGVDLGQFRDRELPETSRGPAIIGVIGRMTPIKGQRVFIKALAKVVRFHPHVKVWMVGDAPTNKPRYREDLELLVRRLGLSRYVEFLGVRHDLPDLLPQMDLVVVPSVVQEAFGRVVIEAQACGVPVIASEVGGIVDIIEDTRTGLLVRPNQPQALADAILRLLKDRKLARQLARQARTHVEERFDLQRMIDQTIAVYQEALNAFRILVIKYSAIGDVILVIPSLAAIRRAHPKAHLTVLTGLDAAEVLQRCPHLDDVILYDRRKRTRGFVRFLRLGWQLFHGWYDLVMDLQNNKRSHLLGACTLAARRIGYEKGWTARLLTHRVAGPSLPMPPVEHQFRVLAEAGINGTIPPLELWLRPEDEERVEELLAGEWLSETTRLVGMNLGSSVKWPYKRWPIESFASLADLLAKENIRIVITGSRHDRPLAERFLALTRSKPINAVGRTTLMELACLIKRCAVYITSDSAPLHIAAAVQVPVVAMFGPTDPRRHLPPAARVTVMFKGVHCSPCYRPVCSQHHECMRWITVKEVYQAVKHFLNERAQEHQNTRAQVMEPFDV